MKCVSKISGLAFCIILFTSVNVTSSYALSDILLIKDDDSNSPDMIYEVAINSGYHVDVVIPALIAPEDINSHRLVILSTGSNPDANANNYLRSLLIAYADNGGKLIIEGGHSGYTACVYPGYPGFKNKVLKIGGWVSNTIGAARMNEQFYNSSLANYPAILSKSISFTAGTIYEQDVCEGHEYSEIFYHPQSDSQNGAVIVAPSVNNPRIINMCFRYSSVENQGDAKDLLINSIHNLIGEPVSVTGQSANVSDFMLHQNYPNPFNPYTIISYELRNPGFVLLKVYDAIGCETAELINERKVSGYYKVEFDGSNFASGVYYYRLEVDGRLIDARRMVLVK